MRSKVMVPPWTSWGDGTGFEERRAVVGAIVGVRRELMGSRTLRPCAT